jgi:hypothetical protein
MKNRILITTTILLLSAVCFIACDKDDDDKKDNSLLFKNTVWTGAFNYTAGPVQPVSLEFKEGGQLTWRDLSGELAGTWKMEDNAISIALPDDSGFKADIATDNKLTNIQHESINNWTMVNAQLNAETEESLEGSAWIADNLRITFKAGGLLDMELGPTGASKYPDVPYTHKGKSVRYSVGGGSYKWFLVRNSNLIFKGANKFQGDAAVYPFEVDKN